MILCERPYYNEPGRERYKSDLMSTTYNDEVRTWTFDYALLPWVNAIGAKGTYQGPPTNTSKRVLWQETARCYLLANGKDISRSSQQASVKSKSTRMKNSVQLVNTALRFKGYL
ncbi:hypothetical protein M426DRAFT_326071, partial [Hypoxylon sp. CI-4A]